jgi:predicted transcriptional regulator
MDAGKVIFIYQLLMKVGHRVTIRRIQAETGVSACTIYRAVKQMSRVMPLRIIKGVVLLDRNGHES